MKNFREHISEGFGRKMSGLVEAASGVIDGLARGVIDREAKVEASAAGGGGFRVYNRLAQGGGHAIATADEAEAHAFLHTFRRFGENVFMKQAQDGLDFR